MGRFRTRLKIQYWSFHQRASGRGKRRGGFTLIELMIASLITSIVLLIAWTGLLSVINMSNEAQAVTSRKIEMTRALDIMTQEVRQAQSINRSGSVAANGSTVTLENVVTHAGVSLADLGAYDHIGLYLEIPTNSNITTCTTGTGSVPADRFDSVVYDVRNSPDEWLQPKAVARYGRIPDVDGSIDPCTVPVANDIMADAIAQTNDTPACDGVLSGGDGFHTCQQGDTVRLLFKSAIEGVEAAPTGGAVTSRAFDFSPPEAEAENTAPTSNLVLSAQPASNGATRTDITWSWSGNTPTVNGLYTLTYTAGSPAVSGAPTQTFIPSTAFLNFDLSAVSTGDDGAGGPDTVCFTLDVDTTEQGNVQSNSPCLLYSSAGNTVTLPNS